MDNGSLLNAPPRLSDLHGDDLIRALNGRHEQHKANWERNRGTPPLPVRVLERLFG